MTSARDTILTAVRAADVPPAAAPPSHRPPVVADPVARFATALEAVAGRLVRVPGLDRVRAELALLAESGSMLVTDADLRPADAEPPVQLDELQTTVVRAGIGVAENGAVWVDAAALEPRAALTICRHLVVVLDAADVVADMHAAYARCDVAGGYGLFISGPSTTADVEQCLVIGAHGATGLTCYLVGDRPRSQEAQRR